MSEQHSHTGVASQIFHVLGKAHEPLSTRQIFALCKGVETADDVSKSLHALLSNGRVECLDKTAKPRLYRVVSGIETMPARRTQTRSRPRSVSVNARTQRPRPLEQPGDLVARATQVGGTHYLRLPIQPWDFIEANRLGFFEGNVVKYVARWLYKDGVQDLHKARHYLDRLIEIAERQARADQA